MKEALQDRLHEQALLVSRIDTSNLSKMVRENLCETLERTRDTQKIFNQEGRSFATMAYKIAPPELVAEFLENIFTNSVFQKELSVEEAKEVFKNLLQRIAHDDAATKAENKRLGRDLTRDDVREYCEFLMENTELQLALHNFRTGLQCYFYSLWERMPYKNEHKQFMQTMVDHFGPVNLITKVPFAVRKALLHQKGLQATVRDVDQITIDTAYEILKNGGFFAIKEPDPEGSTISFECPMQGYLHELFIKKGLLLAAIQHTTRQTDRGNELLVEGSMIDKPALAHIQNQYLIQELAEVCIGEVTADM